MRQIRRHRRKVPVRHDAELQRLARQVMKLPHNRPGTDKTYVLQAMFYYNSFLRDIREMSRAAKRTRA
jgi:hypothetical protein